MDLKTRLSNARQKLPLLRRGSQHSQPATTSRATSSASSDRQARRSSLSMSLSRLPAVSSESVGAAAEQRMAQSLVLPSKTSPVTMSSVSESRAEDGKESPDSSSGRHTNDNNSKSSTLPPPTSASDTTNPSDPSSPQPPSAYPKVTLETPTPQRVPVDPLALAAETKPADDQPTDLPSSSVRSPSRPSPLRRQSLVTASNARAIKTLLSPDIVHAALASGPSTQADYFSADPATFNAGMLHRKIWVKRPNASATLVQIREDDLVDDVRDMILRKYANSLGKAFDSPDLCLRIVPRDTATGKTADRVLGPEEDMCRTLDAYYPGGQTVNEALLIEVPQRRTPKPSPRIPTYYHHPATELQPPHENGEYFPPMMPVTQPSPANSQLPSHMANSIAVLSTGHLPALPSPGAARRLHHGRPKYIRQHTASPTAMAAAAPSSASGSRPQRPRQDSTTSDTKHSTSSGNPPIPTPPAVPASGVQQVSNPPTPRVASPRPGKKPKKQRAVETPSLPAGLLDNSVPPINVLIVEDNVINLRVLGAFMQRLKVRWQKAMNGKEAVTKWRAGGFHLVLMDIQLPIMNGLEATKEIRRLERVNSIGVFSSGSSEAPNTRLNEDGAGRELQEDDKLGDKSLFKSPVIIVALTASSLQSDRHEALAAGCNDFLTKPVNFVWLERKVKEWGCMQALIDYDGWRRWKDFAASQNDKADAAKSSIHRPESSRPKPTLSALSPTSGHPPNTGVNGVVSPTRSSEDDKKSKRRSMGLTRPPTLPEEESTAMSEENSS